MTSSTESEFALWPQELNETEFRQRLTSYWSCLARELGIKYPAKKLTDRILLDIASRAEWGAEANVGDIARGHRTRGWQRNLAPATAAKDKLAASVRRKVEDTEAELQRERPKGKISAERIRNRLTRFGLQLSIGQINRIRRSSGYARAQDSVKIKGKLLVAS